MSYVYLSSSSDSLCNSNSNLFMIPTIVEGGILPARCQSVPNSQRRTRRALRALLRRPLDRRRVRDAQGRAGGGERARQAQGNDGHTLHRALSQLLRRGPSSAAPQPRSQILSLDKVCFNSCCQCCWRIHSGAGGGGSGLSNGLNVNELLHEQQQQQRWQATGDDAVAGAHIAARDDRRQEARLHSTQESAARVQHRADTRVSRRPLAAHHPSRRPHDP